MIHETAPEGFREMEVYCWTNISDACVELAKETATTAASRFGGNNAAQYPFMRFKRVYGKGLDEKQWAEAFDQCEHDADNEGGITGFQHGAAMSILRSVWAHGIEIDARKRIK